MGTRSEKRRWGATVTMMALFVVMGLVVASLINAGFSETGSASAAQLAQKIPMIEANGLQTAAVSPAVQQQDETSEPAVEPSTTAPSLSASRQAARAATQTGLPVPRFVSLKAQRVNVRKGPSSEHDVAWVFTQKGLPVEIIAEFELWRRVRDSEGAEGWVYHSMLSGRRTALVAPWKGHSAVPIYAQGSKDASVVALAKGGVIGDVDKCDGQWCEIETGGYHGYVEQTMLWGVYPGEQVSN